MIRDDLNVLADALQNSRHDNGAEQRAELIADAGQCILLRVKAGQLFGMAGGKRLYALVLCTGGSLGQQQRGADIVLQQLQRAVEEFRAGNALGTDPLTFLQHAHAVTVRSGPQIAAADPDVIRFLAVILRIFQALGIRLLAYLCQRKGKVLQLIRKAGVGIKVTAAVQDATDQKVEHQLLRAAALGYKGGYDLILIDIEMTFLDGMSAAKEIRRADPEVLIIFITNSPQYAIKGYAVQALDYILKPLSYYAFCQRMNHVRELLGRRQKHFLTVPCAGGVQKLDVSDIYYVEICDHDLLFHTKQGEVHSTGSMREVEQKLPPENFFRSSKAYLVNLEHVDGIQDEDAIVNGERVQISRAKRKAFLAALNHYMGETI